MNKDRCAGRLASRAAPAWSTPSRVSVEYSLWSSPQQQTAPASNRCPGASGCPAKLHGMGAMSDEHSGRTTHLDNVARVA